MIFLQDLLARHTKQCDRAVLQPSGLYLCFLVDNNSLHLPRIIHQLHLLLQYRVSPTEERILKWLVSIEDCDLNQRSFTF